MGELSYFDTLPRASINGIEFPYAESKVSGGARIGKHEARFRPGAVLEPHARTAYEITITAIFDSKARGYPDLIAARNEIRKLFDSLATVKLVLPTEGTINVKAEKWVSAARAGVRSGVAFEMSFIEDSTADEFLGGEPVPINVVTIDGSVELLLERAQALPVSDDLYSKLLAFTDECLEAKAMVEEKVYLAEAKVRSLLEVARQIDVTAQELQHPESWQIVDALHDVGAALDSLSQTFGLTSEIRTYVVARDMTIQELSQATYGDTQHTSDLLNLNAKIEDPSLVPAGLVVRYVPEHA